MAFKATKANSAQEQSYAHSCLVSSDYQNGDDYRYACMHLPFSESWNLFLTRGPQSMGDEGQELRTTVLSETGSYWVAKVGLNTYTQ